MTTTNAEIKKAAKSKRVHLYEIADKMGIFDSAFSRKLRKELPTAEKQEIFKIIDDIAAEKENAAD